MQMPGPRRPFPILRRAGVLAAGLGGCALLGGCLGDPFKEAKVDPQSPVAADVVRVTSAKASFPRFRDIPAPSKDNRPIALYGQSAHQLEVAAAQVVQATEPNTWTLQNSEAFAEEARKNVGPELPPVSPSATDEDLKRLRERATPPPPRPRR
jgi:hypothetical protein